MDPTKLSKDQANEVLNAKTHFTNHLYNFTTSMSLRCAVELGIADAIQNHGKPMTLSDLAISIPIHPRKAAFLHQLMRILTHSGFFAYSGDENVYSLTLVSQLLLKDHPFSVKPYILLILDPLLVNPWIDLSDWFQNDVATPFHSVNGIEFWECTSRKPELSGIINGTMAGDSRMVSKALMANPLSQDLFGGIDSLVDVGGGIGEMAKAIAIAFPLVKCRVLELPHVVEGLEGTHNLSFIAGDMFVDIPSTNAILLKWILHDWDDECSVKILKQCKKAITSNESNEGKGKVIIIDIVMEEDKDEEDYKTKETQLFYDMEMMTAVAGKERSRKQWEKLFLDAGFMGGFKVYPLLGFRSIIELYP